MPYAGYSKATRAAIKAIVPSSRAHGMRYDCEEVGLPYFYNSTSTTTPDNELVLIPDDNPAAGRWLRRGASLAISQVWRASQTIAPKAIAFASAITLDCALSNSFVIAPLTDNITISFVNLAAGQTLSIWFEQDASGSRTVTFEANRLMWAKKTPQAINPSGATVFSGHSFDGTKIVANLLPDVG